MPLKLDDIPDHATPPPLAEGKTAALRALRVPGTRRMVLRAVVLGAMTLGAAVLDWAGAVGGRLARAEIGAYGLQGWDRTDCRDAYPSGYAELPDTSGQYANTYAACFGGTWRSSSYCEGGWHKYGTWYEGGVRVDHVPISTACGTPVTGTKNAWKWTTPDGRTYRCSDGYSTFYADGQGGHTYLTICRA